MKSFSHRQRVEMAFHHQEPDRIPMDLMGNASMLLDATYLRLRDYLGFSAIPPVRSGTTANYYDERILEHFDIDFRRIFLKKNPQSIKTEHVDGSFTDPWGVRYVQEGPFINAVGHPLSDVSTVEEVEAYPWPKASDMFTAGGLAKQARKMYEGTDFALVARNPLSEGFLDRSCHLMGMAEFLITLASSPDIAKAIIAHILEIYKDVYTLFLEAIGPYVQMVEASDDLGYNESTFISPGMYCDFIKPAEAELYKLIHQKAPNAAIFQHTDGAIFDIIPDLIEVGVTVLNPVQTSCRGMDAYKLKESYGEKITFHGAMENIEGQVSSPEIVDEVKHRIDNLAAAGGYVLASCNHMIDVKPENIVAMFETAREYGRYR
jgi:uroporphyrinogen decarboxylase